MRLTPQQVADYDRDGFLILPALVAAPEIAALQGEAQRLAGIQSDFIKRERNGLARSILRVHESDGDTASPEFRALARLPRLLEPARQLVRDAQVYIYHTKLNIKPALYGGIYSWHQDFGTWQRDGVASDNIVTAMVMLEDAEEIGGALYFVAGSHKLGDAQHLEDKETGALNPLSVERRALTRILEARKPQPIVGKAGTVVFFHSALVHGSGHNMSPRDRRQIYIVYNPVANKPVPPANPRPDFVCSRNCEPIETMEDDAILRTREATS